MRIKILYFWIIFCGLSPFELSAQQVFRNPDVAIEDRIEDLLKTLTLEEKISMLGYNFPGIDRLGIPAYNWWNEALHGIARGGEATVFPQAIAMAATFNPLLIEEVSEAISTEARAKFNLTTRNGKYLQYMGLTFWTPNINIFRDPRWGRGQETYGEDPFLTASIGVAFVKGLQGNNPDVYLKTAACAKHFAVHSGPEAIRHYFNAVVDEKDLHETYLYAFKKLIDNKVEAVMCGYNRLNGEPCCTDKTLLKDILRNEWNFKGHIVTDCWALDDIWLRHKVLPTRIEVAASAVKAGVNLDCADILQEDVEKAIDMGLLSEDDVNQALESNIRTQIKLGFFDPPESSPYYLYGADSIHNDYHISLSREVARQSMVLLKNNGVLPIKKKEITTLMVLGTNSSSLDVLLGNYHGISGNMVTFAEGIASAAGPDIVVQYEMGCDYLDTVHFGGIWAAQYSDVIIAVIGLTPLLEGEDGDAFLSGSGGDKPNLDLPKAHIAFMKKLRASYNKPVIAVITAGSNVDISSVEAYADAIILAWYPGEQGGNALADIIFGDVSPSGRLPVTFYNKVTDLPDYENYEMKGRTYRYYQGDVQYPFGYGLSYTSFSYDWSIKPLDRYSLVDTINFTVHVNNDGRFDSDEIVQVYIDYPEFQRMPLKELKAFKKINVSAGATCDVSLNIPVSEILKWDLEKNEWRLYKGTYSVCIGANSNDFYLKKEFTVNKDQITN